MLEGLGGLIEFADDIGDEKEDGSHGRAPTFNAPFAASFSAVIGQGCQTDEFGDCFVRIKTDLGKVSHDGGNAMVSRPLD